MTAHRILIVEDDPRIQTLIRQVLEKEGHHPKIAPSLQAARRLLKQPAPDLVMLDRRLPDGDGLDLCREIRSRSSTRSVPILFLTSRDTTVDKVLGLTLGGDDYLTKPFEPAELAARVAALLRRSEGSQPGKEAVLSKHGIRIDLATHQCVIGTTPVPLWPKEFELLKTFLEAPGRLLSKDYLARRVWDREHLMTSRAIDTAVQRLRKRLGEKGSAIETVKGYGYRLKNEP